MSSSIETAQHLWRLRHQMAVQGVALNNGWPATSVNYQEWIDQGVGQQEIEVSKHNTYLHLSGMAQTQTKCTINGDWFDALRYVY